MHETDGLESEIKLYQVPIERVGTSTQGMPMRSKIDVSNSWYLSKQDAISNKIPLKVKTFKVDIVEALSASPPTNKSVLTDDEDNSVVITLAKRWKHYNPPAIHVMTLILATLG
ncbi:uncharacterized protein TNCV_2867391 [Trichonephila clavipes]|nr:uncharacterized protein TNCV_2867391 [Trichonephila clavipes]